MDLSPSNQFQIQSLCAFCASSWLLQLPFLGLFLCPHLREGWIAASPRCALCPAIHPGPRPPRGFWPAAGARWTEWSGECSSREWAQGGELDFSDLHSPDFGPGGQQGWKRRPTLVAAPPRCVLLRQKNCSCHLQTAGVRLRLIRSREDLPILFLLRPGFVERLKPILIRTADGLGLS